MYRCVAENSRRADGVMGAIVGDVCGSIYEHKNRKTVWPRLINLYNPACRFTDDTVMTVATMDALLTHGDFAKAYFEWGNRYPHAGYGGRFKGWLKSGGGPYGSYGNGSAMRAGPCGWVYDSFEHAMDLASRAAIVTHNHPEGVKGARAVALAVCRAADGDPKRVIKDSVQRLLAYSRDSLESGEFREYGYDLSRSLADIRPGYAFDESCQGTVPEAITAFLESRSFTHALQLAISIGGDTDTVACVAGAVAGAYYRIPGRLLRFVRNKLPGEMLAVIDRFKEKFGVVRRWTWRFG